MPDTEPYRIFGSELSPYSLKVRAYCRYKGIAHDWQVRTEANREEFQRYAKLPLVPLVVTPEDEALQDSTPILETLEERFPEPSIHPEDPALAFVSALLEEFGDEWGNKWMFHLRWAREADQQSAAARIVRGAWPDLAGEAQREAVAGMIERMLSRVWFVGSNETNAPQIEDSFRVAYSILETHLASRPYLFGAKPAFGDFGLGMQLYCAWTDPTAGEILEREAPAVVAWVKRMQDPKAEGEFESWDILAPTLMPLLEREVGARFLPWSDANARALAAGDEEFSVELAGRTWTQKPQKYHARSLAALRRRYAAVADGTGLEALLERSGCLRWLRE